MDRPAHFNETCLIQVVEIWRSDFKILCYSLYISLFALIFYHNQYVGVQHFNMLSWLEVLSIAHSPWSLNSVEDNLEFAWPILRLLWDHQNLLVNSANFWVLPQRFWFSSSGECLHFNEILRRFRWYKDHCEKHWISMFLFTSRRVLKL